MSVLASLKIKAAAAMETAHTDIQTYVKELEAEVVKYHVLPWAALAVGIVVGYFIGHHL